MPIKDALNIILDGENKHFDSKVTEAFLSLPCDVIVDILINEYKMQFNNKDRKILSSLTLKQFAEMLNKKNIENKEKEIINVFNKYYIRNKDSI